MKAVLISIQPRYCELIAIGQKTLEVRKNKPKLKTPVKCYIYQTRRRWLYNLLASLRSFAWADAIITGQGKVIGEFVCDYISPIAYTMDSFADAIDCKRSCLKQKEFIKYGKGKPLYGWNIYRLVIYDNPKELSEFTGLRKTKFGYEPVRLKRPPQSWCYVEEV